MPSNTYKQGVNYDNDILIKDDVIKTHYCIQDYFGNVIIKSRKNAVRIVF